MTNREGFLRLMAYEPVDRLPVLALEPFEPTAIERWRTEGLPADADVVDFLGMARLNHVPVNFGPIPGFAPEVLSEDADYQVVMGPMGATIRQRRDNPTMFYGHLDHPVKTRTDWQRYRERFQASSPGRLPDEWEATVAPQLDASTEPTGLCLFPFFFRLGFYAMGMEHFLMSFHTQPELMHQVFADWSRFVCDLLDRILPHVRLDYAIFAEDLAGKNGPLVSPQTYREFWRPHQAPIIERLHVHGVPVICQWSAGEFAALLPEMMDQGMNATWPLEVMAGMDAARLRSQFGPELRLGGNIAKEAVIAGLDAIDREIERLQPLIEEGAFLPALDDMASPDMPFPHYRYLIERLQAIRVCEAARG